MADARAPASTAGEDIPEGLRDRWEWCAGREMGWADEERVLCETCRQWVGTERVAEAEVFQIGDDRLERATVRHLRKKAEPEDVGLDADALREQEEWDAMGTPGVGPPPGARSLDEVLGGSP